MYTLVNSGNFNQAFNFSKKIERDGQESFESEIIKGIFYFKNSNYQESRKFFLKAKNREPRTVLERYIANSLYFWSGLNDYNLQEAKLTLSKFDTRLESLKKIQEVFLNCFYESRDTEDLFNDLVSSNETDFSRYNYFFANYLNRVDKNKKAKEILKKSLKQNPRNLLIGQYDLDLKNSKNSFEFNCKKQEHVAAELIYIISNAFSSQSIYPLSNFYLNLAKYLNKDFYAFDTLLAENFYKIEDYKNAKIIYKRLEKHGDVFKWFSTKIISKILILEEEKEKSLQLIKKTYDELDVKGIYETFDYAQFLKNNEQFKNQ